MFFFSCCSADVGDIFDILDETFIDAVEDLTFDKTKLKPDIMKEEKNNIVAHIDIVGFNGTVERGGILYCHDPLDTVLDYDAQGNKFVRGWNKGVDKIETSTKVYLKDGKVAAVLSVDMTWHKSVLKPLPLPHIKKTYYHEHAEFTDWEFAPKQEQATLDNITAAVTVYNNTVSPRSAFVIPVIPSEVTKIVYEYQGTELVHYRGIGQEKKTKKKIPYLSITMEDIWTDDSTNLSRSGYTVYLNSLNYTDVNITLRTPFESYTIEKYNVTVNEQGKVFSPLFLWFAAMLCLFSAATIKMLRRSIRR